MIKSELNLEHVSAASSLKELNEINNPLINLSIMNRKPQKNIAKMLKEIKPEQFPEIDAVIDVSEIRILLDSKFRKLKELYLDAANDLINDLSEIAQSFSEISSSDIIKLSAECITDYKCPLFHCDYYALRLVSTYYGRGTEWTYNDNVNRSGLGSGNNRLILKDMRRTRRMKPFDVAILKGETYKNNSGRGIVHRSPDMKKGDHRIFIHMDV